MSIGIINADSSTIVAPTYATLKVQSAARFVNSNGKPTLRLQGTVLDTTTVLHASLQGGAARVTREQLESNDGIGEGLSASELVAKLVGADVAVRSTSADERSEALAAGAKRPDEWVLVGNGPKDDDAIDF